jgi:methylthioribulose-1-phosphate dehydratase
MTDNLQLTQLVDACRWIGAKGWAPATGGNMSVRRTNISAGSANPAKTKAA